MGLFSTLGESLVKLAVDSASGIEYVNKEEINSKANDFLLHYKYLLNKANNANEKMEIVVTFVITAIGVSKADGDFSDTEVIELIHLMEGSLEGEISREEALETIQNLSTVPLDIETLGRTAIKIADKYGELSLETLRKFIEYMIYADGEVHPKELEFLNNWDSTIRIQKRY